MKWAIAALGVVGNISAFAGVFGPKWGPVVAAVATLALALNKSLKPEPAK